MIPENMVIIKLHKFKFEILGAPSIIPGYDDLVVFIDWSDNQGEWTSVTVQGFQQENGTPVAVSHTNGVFTNGGISVNRVSFDNSAPPGTRYYKYELVYQRSNGETFIVDPTLVIRPIGP